MNVVEFTNSLEKKIRAIGFENVSVVLDLEVSTLVAFADKYKIVLNVDKNKLEDIDYLKRLEFSLFNAVKQTPHYERRSNSK